MRLQSAVPLPCGHRAAQFVGLVGAEVCRIHGQLHHLLLEQRHAERAFQYVPESRRRILDCLFTVPAPQVGMHHVALDRARPHDRHLNHQIVEIRRPVPRQHRHLRAAFDLEHTHRVGTLDQLVSGAIVRRDRRQRVIHAIVRAQQIEAFAYAGQHAQCQAIDLQHAHGVQIVFVPLDDGAIRHRRVFHRHHLVQRHIGNHETAHVLRQVPRHAEQFMGQLQHAANDRTVRIETLFAQAFLGGAVAPATRKDIAELIHLVQRKAQRLGHVAYRAAAAIADHRSGQRGALAPVLRVDVLDHLLAPLVLEIDIDVGRLVAVLADEARDQQVIDFRIHLGHAQRKAHGGVGGRAAALAENAFAAREAHDVVHGEEERFVPLQFDQRQLRIDQFPHLVAGAIRPAPAHACLDQMAQPAGGAVALGHQLFRVVVTKFCHVERAAFRDAHAFAHQCRRIDRRQRVAPAQVAFAVAEDQRTRFGDRHAMPDRGERVLQHQPATHVHVHVAAGHQREIERAAQRLQVAQARCIVGPAMQLHRQPSALAEGRAHPAALCDVRLQSGQPQGQRARQAIAHVGAGEPVRAFLRCPPPARDQVAERRIALPVLAQQHQLRSIVELELGAHDQLHAGFARGL